MKYFKSILSIIYFIFLTASVFSQERNYEFTRINQLEGNGFGQVNDIIEDERGFIWFSEESNGALTRYDGFNVKKYFNDPQDPNSLGGSYIECLEIDNEGNIWIGFLGQGLDMFNPITETFIHYDHDPSNENGLSDNLISDVVEGPDGLIYIATFTGLNILDPTTGEIRKYSHDPNDPFSISSDFVRRIYFDKSGTLWIGTGWFTADPDAGGLNKYDKENDRFIRFMADPSNPKALQHHRVTALFEDSKGNFWIGTGEDGLHQMNRAEGTFEHFPYDPENPENLSIPAYTTPGYGVTFIAEDPEGRLWVGGHGVDIYDLGNNTFQHFGGNRDFKGTFIENSSWCIAFARNGMIWLSTQPGIYKIDPSKYIIPIDSTPPATYYLESPTIEWVGSSDGLRRKDLTTGQLDYWPNNDQIGKGIRGYVNVIHKASDGNVWIGTTKGVFRIESDNQIRQVEIKPFYTQVSGENVIVGIVEDDNRQLWIATKNGAYVYNEKTGYFEYFNINNLREIKTTIVPVYSFIVKGAEHELWIGHESSGTINKLNTKNFNYTLTEYHPGNGHYNMLKDHKNKLWLASQTGLQYFSELEDKFIRVVDKPCYGLVMDREGYIWTNTISDIYEVRMDGEILIEYEIETPKEEGIYFDPLWNRGSINSDGEISLGDTVIRYTFNPDKIQMIPDTSRLFFTQLNWEQIESEHGDIDQGQISLLEASEINLEYEQNSFFISFTELDYRSQSNNRIQYRLVDYDLGWRETFSEVPVFYSNLPHGEYQMEIKASNSISGIPASKSLSIIIAAPWYQTWWAYFIYAILFVAGILAFDKWRKAKLLEAEREKTRQKELEQARKIEQAFNQLEATHKELQTTQSQLIQSEKMASLGELTAGIAHEIQNPLNFVNNFSDINSELIEELVDGIRQGNLDEALELATDIKTNEEKIKHHGGRADAIVKGMLQHSRNNSGEKLKTDINALTDEYLRLAYHGLRAKDKSFNATIETNLDDSIEPISIVPQEIGRVLLNLITNAFQAVHASSKNADSSYKPTVAVTTNHNADASEIVLTISDNGDGIPAHIIDKIFQPFFTTKPTGEGTGLGLSLAYDIIYAHGGEITVDSAVGKGTNFILTMPK